MTEYATQAQVDWMKETLLQYQLFTGHYDRLWKLLEVHEVDVRNPGDGTRMSRQTADQTVAWLQRQIVKMQPGSEANDHLQYVYSVKVFEPGGGPRNHWFGSPAERTAWLERNGYRDDHVLSYSNPEGVTGLHPQRDQLHRVSTQPPADGRLADVEENQGVYLKNGEVYVVKLNKAKTHLYAKRLVEAPGDQRRVTEAGTRSSFDLEYAPGVMKTLRPSDRMRLEDAREVMTKYGRCLYCRHPLKAADSVERMVGPVCSKRFAA